MREPAGRLLRHDGPDDHRRVHRPTRGAPTFPAISTRDQARAQWALLDALGIERLALVAGGSLGGMVALEVALERPEAVGEVLPIAAPAATGALAIAWNRIQLELVDGWARTAWPSPGSWP